MPVPRSNASVSRRSALTGLGFGGLAITASRMGALAQNASPGDLANHPIVGLWQFNSSDPGQPPDMTFECFHGDGIYITYGGLRVGAALGIWRPTGERTGDWLQIWQDIDPTMETEGEGTVTFWSTLTVNEEDTTLTFSNTTIDVRDAYGTLIFQEPWADRTSTRMTFDIHPGTGSTVTTGTPEAATPES